MRSVKNRGRERSKFRQTNFNSRVTNIRVDSSLSKQPQPQEEIHNESLYQMNALGISPLKQNQK